MYMYLYGAYMYAYMYLTIVTEAIWMHVFEFVHIHTCTFTKVLSPLLVTINRDAGCYCHPQMSHLYVHLHADTILRRVFLVVPRVS